MTNEDPRQYTRPEIDREMMHKLLDHLIDLRERTDPQHCEDPSDVHALPDDQDLLWWLAKGSGENADQLALNKGKDAVAQVASRHVMYIVDHVCGWAFDHIVGYRLLMNEAEKDLGVTEGKISTNPNHHEIEETGRDARLITNEKGGLCGNDQFRSMLREYSKILIAANSLTPMIWGVLAGCIEALEYGQYPDPLQPEKTGRKGINWKQWNQKLRAACFVRFLQGLHGHKGNAVQVVANAYGETETNVNYWITNAPKYIKDADVSMEKARRAGELHRDIDKMQRDISEFPDEDRRIYYEHVDELRVADDPEQLWRAASHYRRGFKQRF